MRSLGLDISQTSTGWAVLEDGHLVDYGVLEFDRKTKLSGNLFLFQSFLDSIFNQYGPLDIVSIEDTYVGKNPKTTKLLTRFSGVSILSARQHCPSAKIYVLAVASIRSAHFPGRKVDKKDVYVYICSKYGLSNVKNDVTDAIAAGEAPLLRKDLEKWEV